MPEAHLDHGMFYKQMLKKALHTPIYMTADNLCHAIGEYFEWCVNYPLLEDKTSVSQGEIIRYETEKMRAFSMGAMCNHLGISEAKLKSFKQLGDDWERVIDMAESIVRSQKFEGAAAGLLNANIIARDIGLADKADVALSGGTGADGARAPITFEIQPVASGTFLSPDEPQATDTP